MMPLSPQKLFGELRFTGYSVKTGDLEKIDASPFALTFQMKLAAALVT